MVKVYGIPNCGSVKKAFTWLAENNIKFQFIDFKKEGISELKLQQWLAQKPLEIVLNKNGTTWKGLTGVAQKKATNQKEAIKLMIQNTSLIKRPIIECDNILLIGFDEVNYTNQLK